MGTYLSAGEAIPGVVIARNHGKAGPDGRMMSIERHQCILPSIAEFHNVLSLKTEAFVMPMLLSTASVSGLTGATIRMIGHWAKTGLLRPSGQDASGKGSRRRYTFQDVIVLQAILTLRQGNCPLQKVRTAIRYLQAHYPHVPAPQALARLTLLTDGKKVYLLTDEHELMDVVTRQLHITWAVPLGRIILDTNQRLDAMPHSWTETTLINARPFHIEISRDRVSHPFVARCRELPGAVVEGPSADDAVSKLRESISFALAREPLTHARRRQNHARVAS